MKKPHRLYKTLGPKTRLGGAFRRAHYHRIPSLRSAFRGVEWVVAGLFGGATLSRLWVQKFMATMSKMHLPYGGQKLSALFSMMAGFGRKKHLNQDVRPRIG